jgi:hypothetical protein
LCQGKDAFVEGKLGQFAIQEALRIQYGGCDLDSPLVYGAGRSSAREYVPDMTQALAPYNPARDCCSASHCGARLLAPSILDAATLPIVLPRLHPDS